jgi:hypothetical protein
MLILDSPTAATMHNDTHRADNAHTRTCTHTHIKMYSIVHIDIAVLIKSAQLRYNVKTSIDQL